MSRVWHISCYDHDTGRDVMQDFYDRDEVSKFLLDMDIRGYCLTRWDIQCLGGASELVRVNIVLEFVNWNIHNIPERLDEIIGRDDGVFI